MSTATIITRWLLSLALILCLPAGALAEAGGRCVRLQLEGTIDLEIKNPQDTRGQAGNATKGCTTQGKFRIELIFPEKGGQASSQKNWVAFDGFDCTGAECRHQVASDAFKPRPFTLTAGMKPAGAFNYDVDFLLTRIPPPSPIKINIACPQGTPAEVSDYGANYRQLMLPFQVNKMSLNCRLNQSLSKHPPAIDMGRFLNADLQWQELTTLVPCKNFQY